MPKGVKYGGREKGTPNRFTALKDAFLDAFESNELKGTEGLIAWAKKEENRKDFYMLVAKMLPKNVTVDMEHSGSINVVSTKAMPEDDWETDYTDHLATPARPPESLN